MEDLLGACFPAGTPVATADGVVPVEAVKVGEKVWAYDLVESQWRTCRVLQTFTRKYEGNSASITVAGETIEATFLHPFWVVRGDDLVNRPVRKHLALVPKEATTPGRWVDAGDIRVGDELLLRDGRILPVEAVRHQPYFDQVYNFKVEELECYAVGPNSVLVHNTNGSELLDLGDFGGDGASLWDISSGMASRLQSIDDQLSADAKILLDLSLDAKNPETAAMLWDEYRAAVDKLDFFRMPPDLQGNPFFP